KVRFDVHVHEVHILARELFTVRHRLRYTVGVPHAEKGGTDGMHVIEAKRSQGASSEVVRDINRRVVLNLIRTRQPISRADLARASGLQRSTISLIVEQLIEERWVLEGPTGRLPRGRHPTYLRLNNERVIIGVDIRPTQTTVALSDVNGKFTPQEVLATSPDPKVAMEELIQAIRRIADSG